ncbi:hypothetical protein MAR_010305 [Mya arenaria]|uniref:Uncharacterized protein n=1 Tax=Mya arenaria TaxID=6604 RepID=A0ABY7E4M1_MYAAR|nr:hypothetical protein MAR_010305 [Mya arenaria]
MCWNLYIWMLVEARLATSYMELPTAADTSKAASSKATPDNPAKIVSKLWLFMIAMYEDSDAFHLRDVCYGDGGAGHPSSHEVIQSPFPSHGRLHSHDHPHGAHDLLRLLLSPNILQHLLLQPATDQPAHVITCADQPAHVITGTDQAAHVITGTHCTFSQVGDSSESRYILMEGDNVVDAMCPSRNNVVNAMCPLRDNVVDAMCPSRGNVVDAMCPSRNNVVDAMCPSRDNVVDAMCSSRGNVVDAMCPSRGNVVDAMCPSRGNVVDAMCPSSYNVVDAMCTSRDNNMSTHELTDVLLEKKF